MYRQYENPHELEEQLKHVKEEFARRKKLGELEPYDYEDYAMEIADLEERINFAWQDDEYDNYSDDIDASDDIDGKEAIEGAGLVSGISGLLSKGMKFIDSLLGTIEKSLDDDTIDKMRSKEKGTTLDLNTDWDYMEVLTGGDYPEENQKKGNYPYLFGVKLVGEGDDYVIVDYALRRKGDDNSKAVLKKGVKIGFPDDFDTSNITDESFTNEEFADLVQKTIASKFEEVLQELFPKLGVDGETVEDMQPITLSTNLKLTLKKIVANDVMDIQLISVDSPYEVDKTNEIINSLVDAPDFVSSLPEMEPASYEVCIDDDCYDVEPCDGCCVDMSDCIMKVLKPLYTLYFDSMSLTWNAKGTNYPAIATLADTYMWTVRGLIDQLSIEHYAKFNYAPHPAYFMQEFNYPTSEKPAIEVLQDDIYDLVNTIELYYCNFDGILQKCLIDAKDMFNTELNYTLARFSE